MVLSLLLISPDGGGAGVEPMNVMHTNLSGGGKKMIMSARSLSTLKGRTCFFVIFCAYNLQNFIVVVMQISWKFEILLVANATNFSPKYFCPNSSGDSGGALLQFKAAFTRPQQKVYTVPVTDRIKFFLKQWHPHWHNSQSFITEFLKFLLRLYPEQLAKF